MFALHTSFVCPTIGILSEATRGRLTLSLIDSPSRYVSSHHLFLWKPFDPVTPLTTIRLLLIPDLGSLAHLTNGLMGGEIAN